ncbi:T9SS type B sorting domain-containing protein [Flavobacterium silvaticum]|uniref:T9SS type B sorting domain-containing protein n=1 Tax=Flavobacterium silvaticum TaxID=1852020 RepID=A0A972JH18_9FLAO|nr:gliding motility-associated C-terminal domain-containing protein [Flavobacterium silvaticum]NMH26653.1 T9SS type B sorting domain-containing protein [Flavobacterium silvaticum]
MKKLLWLAGLFVIAANAQNISLYQQFNGPYDFTFVGNTLNPSQNGLGGCSILTQSSETLTLGPGDSIVAAYLYWAGSGTGDFNVTLNGSAITASRTFSTIQASSGMPHFGAFADVTALVQATGPGLYTLSDLDLTAVINDYCSFGGNFAGWSLVVVYSNVTFDGTQINVYDGFQNMPDAINVSLNNLNVVNTNDAKIGFIAWEGDSYNMTDETLRINGNILSNSINPSNNAFNGTNSFTGSTELYNMDLDFYDISSFISVGDTSASVQMTSGFDFVIVSTIVTKMNSQLPDASVVIENILTDCTSRQITIDYTVSNLNSTAVLPSGTSVAFYTNGMLLGTTLTQTAISPDQSENLQVSFVIPDDFPSELTIKAVVDDNGSGIGSVTELDENNNSTFFDIVLGEPIAIPQVEDVSLCNAGFGSAEFDFSAYQQTISEATGRETAFYLTQTDAENAINPIPDIAHFTSTSNPQTIYYGLTQQNCGIFASFQIKTTNCPPTVYNFISVNGDGINDTFIIDGLYDIFLNFKLFIYNRWGALVWQGTNSSGFWDGQVNNGIQMGGGNAPDGTYFYILELNDPDYPNPLNGYLYLTH